MKKVSDIEIINSYKKHNKITFVMEETKASYVKIKRVLQENGLFEQKIKIVRERKFDVDDRYFKEINIPDKAYWLGFLWGDGYISMGYNIVGISLSLKDKSHLEKFKKAIKYDGEIKVYTCKSGYSKGVDYCRIAFTSRDMISDLKNLGFLENKSLIMLPPKENNIPKELMFHFWRGFVDANGSICPANNLLKDKYYLHVLGTIPMIENFKSIFNIKSHSKLYQRQKDCSVYDLRFNITNNNKHILENIYNDSNKNIRLDRKYDAYQECIKNVL